MTIKVKMLPHLSEIQNQPGGIARVIEAYFKHLPAFGIELVSPDAHTYDLVAAHAGITGPECDVAHLHGLYFTADYDASEWEWHVNSRVIQSCRNARLITVPSDWVAETFRRDMHLNPHVVPHGIDWQDWQHKEENQGYVLWNKSRRLDVCDNSILDVLVNRFPEVVFVSTMRTPTLDNKPFSAWPTNFKIIETGEKTPHTEMKRYVQQMGIYLSVAKETFSIGNLEAMASGKPILGWDWGGNSFLVKHGVNGYLAKPGDIDDLCEGLNFCLKHQKVLGENGRELAKLWTWQAACEKVAQVYTLAMREEEATVSVVIPVYNKPIEQVKRAVKSCLEQTLRPKEIVIVDDGSNLEVQGNKGYVQSVKWIVTEMEKTFGTIRGIEIISQPNQGVANARNNGITYTSSKYVTCLDADDFLEPTFLEVCVKELESNRSLGIVYTGLRAWNEDGSSSVSDWPSEFNPDKQLTYLRKQNQVPTCCVFRREAWERVGGYKSRYCPYGAGSEDAALWSAITSIGYWAKKVTDEALFNYSTQGGLVHDNKEYHEVDWLSMYPWAKDGLHPFASVATPKRWSHPVRQYDQPLISVVIPVGPGHEKEVENALDSLEMQTFRKWEVIVMWDSNDEIPNNLIKAYPYVKLWKTPALLDYQDNGELKTKWQRGAGVARNEGVKISRAPLIFFLDADDVLASPDTLQKMLDAWNAQESIIYSDYLGKAQWDYDQAQKEFGDRLLGYNYKQGTAVFRQQSADFNPELAQRQPELNTSNPNMPYYHWCLVSVLLPKAWHVEIGGFDESMFTWEDVDYHWRLARAGHCFYRLPEPLVLYSYHKGHRREKSAVTDESSLHQHKTMIQYIKNKYKEIPVKMCNCGPKKKATVTAQASSPMSDSDFVLIEFDFPGSNARSSYGQPLKSPTRQVDANGRVLDYQGYSRRKGDKFLVHVADQKARPSMFLPVQDEVRIPEVAKQELPEPTSLVTKPLSEPTKKRGRPAKVAA